MTVCGPQVVVTRRMPAPVEEALRARFPDVRLNADDTPFTAEQLVQALQEADIVVTTVTDRWTPAVLGAPHVRARLLANVGVGYNHIDVPAARAAGLTVTNTPDVLTEDTADIAIALVLMTLRRLGEGERLLRAGAWTGLRPTFHLGRTLRGKVLGIVGYGRIGRATARIAAAGFGMRVVWHAPRDPRVDDPATAGPADAERMPTLEALLRASDVVSLHCPATPETRHLMNAHTLAQMKPDAVLVNTARGDVVDEAALVAALQAGTIAGAGLDVYEFEPKVTPALLAMEPVVLLPHLGSATVETRSAMGLRAVANIDAFTDGRPCPDAV